MKTPVFVSFCLLIVGAVLAMHVFFSGSMGPEEQLKRQIAALEKARASADLRSLLLAHEFIDFQQHVATLVPDAIKGRDEQAAYPLRQLASIAAGANDSIELERSSGLFEKAKEAFRQKDYEESNSLLTQVCTKFPGSAHIAEAYFLLSEGQFQLKDFTGAIQTIEKMVDLFPENELTGFALLRLGRIFENQDRIEDAADVYRAVLSNFKQLDLVEQAKASLKGVEL